MDWQSAFNVIFAGFGILGGWVLKSINDRQTKTEDRLDEIPNIYARRDDMSEIRMALVRIESKIDNKADKHA